MQVSASSVMAGTGCAVVSLPSTNVPMVVQVLCPRPQERFQFPAVDSQGGKFCGASVDQVILGQSLHEGINFGNVPGVHFPPLFDYE